MTSSRKSNLTLSQKIKIKIATVSQCHQNISSLSTLRRFHPTKFLRGTLYGGCTPTTFLLRKFYGIVFSKHFLWGNSTELYSQNIFFKTTLRSFIPTFCFRVTLRSCILTTLSFEAILQNCILKTFLLRQFCRILFSKYFLWGNFAKLYSHTSLWGNFAKLYSQNITFEATLQSCISTLSF